MASTKKGSKKVAALEVASENDGPEKPSRENVKFFMDALIQAGHVEEIPEEAKEQVAEAQRLRQFAERLCNQLRKFS